MAVAPISTLGASGNIVAAGTSLAAAASAVNQGSVIDLTTSTFQAFEGELTIAVVFGTVAGTAGVNLLVHTVTAAGTSSTPLFIINVAAVGSSTQISPSVSLPPGRKYQLKASNLDATNAVTIGITLDVISSVG